MSAPTIKLNNGRNIPVLGLGTSQFEDKGGGMPTANLTGTREAVEYAIDLGYRHFDTAYNYCNEGEVGAAIAKKLQEGVVKREDLFVTTKLFSNFHRPELVARAIQNSLTALQLDYVDLYLIHSPIAAKYIDDKTGLLRDADGNFLYDAVDHADTWKAMETLVDQGLARSIGVSNFNKQQLQHVLESCRIRPSVNQVENHAYLMQPELFDYCKSNDIALVAYAPVGSPGRWNKTKDELVLSQDPVVGDISKRLGKSPSQVLLRFMIQRGRIPIPRSTNPVHIKENFEALEFELSRADLSELDGLDRHHRFFDFAPLRTSPQYPFEK
ncbi:Aldo-keto reductase family 1 member C23-like protein [Hypsibius exemplaris]|uniref:Aldo-keto reductase family 1 member C23-like protein n=1 Tax=Hypsibius exemplaris TaxID=2072580 RepID=A0A1W0WE90_HYPEX|nr:Aldo-keto reductase family 1 member C23-like protein [Hypsibius exemplaris]